MSVGEPQVPRWAYAHKQLATMTSLGMGTRVRPETLGASVGMKEASSSGVRSLGHRQPFEHMKRLLKEIKAKRWLQATFWSHHLSP